MATVVVTGSSGTIGTALCQKLLSDGHSVIGVDTRRNQWSERVDRVTKQVDLRYYDEVNDLEQDVDYIIHLAANARVYKLVEQPRLAQENIESTMNILEFARQENANLIFSSSREVYGNKGKVIHSEEDTLVDDCESPYTASKVAGESLVRSYGNCYAIDCSILRFSNVYGRFDASDRVMPLWIAQATNGMGLTVYGASKILDFTYLDDCIDGILAAFANFHVARDSTFNIASGTGTSLVSLAECIQERVGNGGDVTIKPNRTGEVGQYVADVSKAQKLLGYEPKYSIEAGIEETIAWYQNHPDVLAKIGENT